jgi:hypothetical protein
MWSQFEEIGYIDSADGDDRLVIIGRAAIPIDYIWRRPYCLFLPVSVRFSFEARAEIFFHWTSVFYFLEILGESPLILHPFLIFCLRARPRRHGGGGATIWQQPGLLSTVAFGGSAFDVISRPRLVAAVQRRAVDRSRRARWSRRWTPVGSRPPPPQPPHPAVGPTATTCSSFSPMLQITPPILTKISRRFDFCFKSFSEHALDRGKIEGIHWASTHF